MIGIAGVFVWRRGVIGMLSKSPDPPSWGVYTGNYRLAQLGTSCTSKQISIVAQHSLGSAPTRALCVL